MFPNSNNNENPNRRALPTDANFNPVVGGVLRSDGVSPWPLEIDDSSGGVLVYLAGIGTVPLTASAKPTEAYSIQAISETATNKYFFFEDKDLNWYVMRKNLSTNVFSYAKGTGGYASVYVDATSAPSPAQTYASYGATF